jgi:hypothetical protein
MEGRVRAEEWRGYMWRRVFLGPAILGVIVAGLSAVSSAQTKTSAPEPQWLFVTIVKLNPGANAEYVELQTKEVMPAQKKGGATGRQAWSSGVAGPPREIVYFSPIATFAQFDKPAPLVTALGQDGANALNAKVAKLSDQQKSMIIRTRPDLSYAPNPGAPPSALALVSIIDVVPGRRGDFEAILKKDVLAAMQQAKVKGYSVFEIVYGDSAGGYISAIGYDSYEAIGKGHPFQIALGEDGARKLETKVTGIVSHIQRFMSRHRPELSWTATPGS